MARRLALALLLAAAIAPYFVGLGVSSIWDANEAFYVETPREMLERGDYVFPTFNYEPRLNKPVLSYWIVAAFYRAFGVSVQVQRLAITLGALVLIASAYFLALAACPYAPTDTRGARRPISASLAALWAAVGLAANPRLLMFARRIFIDIYISMFMALTLLFFVLAERFPDRRRLFLLLMYVSVGLGVLTKGPIAIALPGLVFAIYLVAHGELRRVRDMMLPAGVLIVLAIVVPWYAALYARDGWTYIVSFFVGENLARYTAGVGVNQARPFYFYLPVVFSDGFPWSLLLVAAAAVWLSERRHAVSAHDSTFRVRTILWIWIATIVVFFSFSRGKQDLYIFPIVPAIAALAGAFIVRAETALERRWRIALRATAAAIGVLLAAAGAGVLFVFHAAGKVYSLDGAALIGALAVIGGGAALVVALTGRARLALFTAVTALVVMEWTFVLRVLPSFERYKPVPALTAALQSRRLTADDVVAHYQVDLPSMVYYLRRHVDLYFEPQGLIEAMNTRRRVFVVISAADYEALRTFIGPSCILHSQPTINVKLKAMLSREPLPQLLLISNRCD
jgi:4-amino-4-deoxy-L-arabinose transferase-like glycosyltransferase